MGGLRVQARSWRHLEPLLAPVPVGELGSGTYTFSVRAIDQAGNVDPTPAVREFTMDMTGPDTIIDEGPASWTNDPDVELRLSAPAEPAVAFECAFVAGRDPWAQPHDFATCTSPVLHPALADDEYLFLVRGIDALGNTGPAANAHFPRGHRAARTRTSKVRRPCRSITPCVRDLFRAGCPIRVQRRRRAVRRLRTVGRGRPPRQRRAPLPGARRGPGRQRRIRPPRRSPQIWVAAADPDADRDPDACAGHRPR